MVDSAVPVLQLWHTMQYSYYLASISVEVLQLWCAADCERVYSDRDHFESLQCERVHCERVHCESVHCGRAHCVSVLPAGLRASVLVELGLGNGNEGREARGAAAAVLLKVMVVRAA